MRLGIIIEPPYADGFDYAKRLGLEFVEYDCNAPEFGGLPTSELMAQVPACQEASARTGIPVSAVGRWASTILKSNGEIDPEEWKNVTGVIDFGEKLGAKNYLASVVWVPELTYYQNITAAIRVLREILAYAGSRGMTVSVVNCMMGGHYIRTPEQWSLILPEVPGLRIKYDPSHSFVHGEKGRYLEEALTWGRYFGYVHIKGVVQLGRSDEPVYVALEGLYKKFPGLLDALEQMPMFSNRPPFTYYPSSYDNPPAGIDMIDWKSFFAALYQCGYDGDLSIEPHSATWEGELGEKGLMYTIRFIRDLMLQ